MKFKNDIKQLFIRKAIISGKHNIQNVTKVLDIEKSVTKIVLDQNDFNENNNLLSLIKIIRNKIDNVSFILCSDNEQFKDNIVSDITILNFDNVSLFGKLNKEIQKKINTPETDILLTPYPLRSKLSLLVASNISSKIRISFGENIYGNNDITIDESSNDWNKKIEVLLHYLKQLNIKV